MRGREEENERMRTERLLGFQKGVCGASGFSEGGGVDTDDEEEVVK